MVEALSTKEEVRAHRFHTLHSNEASHSFPSNPKSVNKAV